MKRVLFLTDTLGSGGAERQIVTIASLLKERGYNVGVICVTGRGFYSELLDEKGLKTFYLRSIPCKNKIRRIRNYLSRLKQIRKCVKDFNCKTLIAFLGEDGLASPNIEAVIISFFTPGCNVIVGKRNNYDIRKRSVFVNKLEARAKYIVSNSQSGINQFLAMFPGKKEKMRVIYNIVEIPPINVTYIPKQEGKLHIVVAASIRPVKNTLGLIKGCALLDIDYRKRLQIDWYGGVAPFQAYYDESVSLIKKNHLEDCIHFHQPIDSISKVMALSDMVALFSESEGLPNAICEAMMLGKPVIMTRCSDYDVLVTDNMNGFLCDWSSPESISKAIQEAIDTDKNKLLEMGRSSKDRAISLFSKDACMRQWLDLINA